MFKITIEREALDNLKKLDGSIRLRIKKFIDQRLRLDPRSCSTLLVGNKNIARARVGDYRIIFKLDNLEKTILIIDVNHRSKIYK